MTPVGAEAYAAVYVSLPWHDKITAIPEDVRPAAFGLYVATLVFCQNLRTDGRVSLPQMAAVFPCSDMQRTRLIEALVTARLLDEEPGALRVHDYLDHNRSRAEIEDARERMVKGGRAGGVKSGEARRRVGLKGGVEASPEKSREEMSSEQSRSEAACTWCLHDDGTRDSDCPDCAGTGVPGSHGHDRDHRTLAPFCREEH